MAFNSFRFTFAAVARREGPRSETTLRCMAAKIGERDR
jgi:hypothetical protein